MKRALLLALLLLPAPCLASDGASDNCAGRGTSVVVSSGDHMLRLCVNGRSTKQFDVALGSGGVGKRRAGDGRTPLGTYALGPPRRSMDGYGIFIPIGYPTAAQRRAGYSGSAVGIHGPPRSLRWAGALTVVSDWTAGCVAVESDAVNKAIARFVREHAKVFIHID